VSAIVMRKMTALIVLAALSAAAAACFRDPDAPGERLPVDPSTGLRIAEIGPVPALPEWPDNPPTDAKKALGKALFFDTRISGSGTAACGNCHLSLTDFQSSTPLDVPDRSYPALGPALPRHTPSLLNIVYARMLRWDGSHFTDLFDMAVLPYAEANMNLSRSLPPEQVDAIDIPGAQAAMLRMLTVDYPGYARAFQDAFGEDIRAMKAEEVWRLAGKAIAVYFRSIVARDAPFDRWNAGDATAMSASAVRGVELFRGKAMCSACHTGPMLSDFAFHNVSTALPDANGARADEGRFKVTGRDADRGAFLTPMLRSSARTSPYFHDGSQTSIAEVIRTKLGDRGRDPNRDPLLDQMPHLTDGEIDDIVQFVKALDGAPIPQADLDPPPTFP
jgi:cytochrome c peroxidase